jgi:endonuclease/exonuclease/phosphatase family metal-dependent hydrolase
LDGFSLLDSQQGVTMYRRLLAPVFAAWMLIVGAASGQAIQLKIRSWNIESGGSDPETIARQIADEQGVDIWGLSEVQSPQVAERLQRAAAEGEDATFERLVGTKGGSDRLVILYNSKRLQRVGDPIELHEFNPGGTGRSPLAVRLRGRTTGQEFMFMVNHLFRGSRAKRHLQAKQLNTWARSAPVPVISVGDYNFDFDAQMGDNPDHRNKGFDLLTKDGVFVWVRPERLIKTQSSNFNSVLDFVFVAGTAVGWKAESRIIVRPGDFPDNKQTSDHRPVEAVFTLKTPSAPPPGSVPPRITKEQLLQRIEALERDLKELKRLAQEIEDR